MNKTLILLYDCPEFASQSCEQAQIIRFFVLNVEKCPTVAVGSPAGPGLGLSARWALSSLDMAPGNLVSLTASGCLS